MLPLRSGQSSIAKHLAGHDKIVAQLCSLLYMAAMCSILNSERIVQFGTDRPGQCRHTPRKNYGVLCPQDSLGLLTCGKKGSQLFFNRRDHLPHGRPDCPSSLEVSLAREYRGSSRLLLCIDHNAAILECVRALLEHSGYVVVTTPSARQGLTLATLSRFDAVVLDYHMPEMNGHQLALKLRRARPETTVIMFSAADIPEETCRLVNAVVRKLDVVTELLPTVDRLCDRLSFTDASCRPI
jgi:CheY-like chemotaxis protein